jgi:carboxyl-terminal processing protease
MNKQKLNYFLGLLSGVALAVIAWVALSPLITTNVRLSGASPQALSAISESGPDMSIVSQKIEQIHHIINSNFIGDFDLELAIELMYAGFVYGAGDPYTTYMDAASFTAFQEQTDGTFVGIGVSVTVDRADNRILVISPFEGSPAFNAGVLPGDKIVRVDGIDVLGEGMNDAINMIRGEVGTEVVITILREATGEILDKTIVREVIQVETVRSNVFNDNIGYIRISQFDRVTYDQFLEAYNSLLAQNIEGLVIDVRNNPGGLLHIVNRIADLLVPEGIITYTEDINGTRTYARSNATQIEIPLVVLVNGNSASASEILAGAVLDTGVGELVGTTTFGKGLVQNVFALSDGSAIKVTIARYYTPNGISIHGDGITPTHYVEMDTELTNNLLRLDPNDDIQLQEALNILNGKIN